MKWLLAIGIATVVLAVFTHVGAKRAEQAFPPVGKFLTIDSLRLHYQKAGSGPPIVLLHGASSNLRDFRASLFEPLSERHRVIAVDRPGHGYSERPLDRWPNPAEQARLIHELLMQLGVERPLLVGHSWSGSVVLAYLLAFPQEAAGGVLLAGGSHPWEGGVAWYNDLAGVPVLGELFARTLALPFGLLVLDGAVSEVFAPNPVPAGYQEQTGVRLSLRPATFLANAEDVRLLSGFLERQRDRYTDIRQPLLLLTGAEDDIVPAWNHAERLVKQVDSAEIVELEATGHALHHAHPERVAELIEGFSSRLERDQIGSL